MSCLIKSLIFNAFSLILLIQVMFQKVFSITFLKKSLKTTFLACLNIKTSRKSSKNYITLHIAEKIKKKKLNIFTNKMEKLLVLSKKNYVNEHFAKKYNEFYRDLPCGFQQISMKFEEKKPCRQQIKEPFFSKKVKILSSTDIRLHDYSDLNGIFSKYCKKNYENEKFNEFLMKKLGKKINFLEIYELFYKRRCIDKKCGCLRNFSRISTISGLKKKAGDSKAFLPIKLTPVLENIEYI